MILLINTAVTNPFDNESIKHRGYYPRDDQLDILKYTISSLASINKWSRALFYIKLDDDWKHRWDELRAHIISEFIDICPTNIYYWRNECQKEWKKTFSEIEDEPDNYIWFLCNHDHVFTDYNLDALDSSLAALDKDPEPRKSVYYSYFPEIYRKFKSLYPNDFTLLPCGNIATRGHWMESTQIVSKELLRSWLVEPDYGNAYMPRTDWKEIAATEPYRLYIPQREICRHYDGSGYIFDSKVVPPLVIPPGFFDNDIKIRYGFKDNVEGLVNINPLRPYKTETPDGVDYRWVLEDIPLFWRDRWVKTLRRCTGAECMQYCIDDPLLEARNQAVRDYLCAPSIHPAVSNDFPPEEYLKYSMR